MESGGLADCWDVQAERLGWVVFMPIGMMRFCISEYEPEVHVSKGPHARSMSLRAEAPSRGPALLGLAVPCAVCLMAGPHWCPEGRTMALLAFFPSEAMANVLSCCGVTWPKSASETLLPGMLPATRVHLLVVLTHPSPNVFVLTPLQPRSDLSPQKG